jgi:hypothetical protein
LPQNATVKQVTDMVEKPDPVSEKISKFYIAVGLAITQWQHVEMALTQLFMILLDAKTGAAASAAFAAVHSFRTKLSMVDAASYVVLRDTPLFAEWTSIHNKLKNGLAQKRNEIAHFMPYQKGLSRTSGEPLPTLEEINREFDLYLAPSAFDGAARRKKQYPNGLTSGELMNRVNAFKEASRELWAFSEKVRAHLGRTGG